MEKGASQRLETFQENDDRLEKERKAFDKMHADRARIRNNFRRWLTFLIPSVLKKKWVLEDTTAVDMAQETAEQINQMIDLEIAIGTSQSVQEAQQKINREINISCSNSGEIMVYEDAFASARILQEQLQRNNFSEAYKYLREELRSKYSGYGSHDRKLRCDWMLEKFQVILREKILELILSKDTQNLLLCFETFYNDPSLQNALITTLQAVPLKHFKNPEFERDLFLHFLEKLLGNPDDRLMNEGQNESSKSQGVRKLQESAAIWQNIGFSFQDSQNLQSIKEEAQVRNYIVKKLKLWFKQNKREFKEILEFLLEEDLIAIEHLHDNHGFMVTLYEASILNSLNKIEYKDLNREAHNSELENTLFLLVKHGILTRHETSIISLKSLIKLYLATIETMEEVVDESKEYRRIKDFYQEKYGNISKEECDISFED